MLQLSISNLEVDPICTEEGRISMHHSWQSLHGVYCHLPWSCHSLEFSASEQIKTTMLCPNQRQRHYIKGTKERTSIFKIPNLGGLQNSHLIACDSLLWSFRLCLWCSTVATLQLQLTCLVILQNNQVRTITNSSKVKDNSYVIMYVWQMLAYLAISCQ